MLEISKDANKNYLAKVVKLEGLKKHSNADRLQTVDIDFQTVITGMDARNGDYYVYFPVEGKISKDFLSYTNSFRDFTANEDYLNSTEGRKNHLELEASKAERKIGFFEDNCRVKAMKLRGEKSMGYIVPLGAVVSWSGLKQGELIEEEFDTINGKLIVEKYVIPMKNGGRTKSDKKPKLSRLIEGQVRLHVDTANLRKNSKSIGQEDMISITYKTHGTSWWVANVLVKRKLSILERLTKFFGGSVQETEYDLVYGSRKVVKNSELGDPKGKVHYFGYDLWEQIKDEVGPKIPKGFTLYGEMLGYDKNGGEIQKGYDYGCHSTSVNLPRHKLEVYRVTQTNAEGLATELNYLEIAEFCKTRDLTPPHLLYYGKAKDWLNPRRKVLLMDEMGRFPKVVNEERDLEIWNNNFIKGLEEDYNEKDCFMCKNAVPEEGIVVRKESLFEYEAYKLKSFRFLEWETAELDKGETNIESDN